VEPGKDEFVLEKCRVIWFGRFAPRVLAPDLPQPVEVAMMGKEDRIAAGGREIGHVAEHLLPILDRPAAGIVVHRRVRCAFKPVAPVLPIGIGPHDAAKAQRYVIRV
jgi:hypothetical protein